MKTRTNLIVACMVLAADTSGFVALHYVDLNSPNPTPPYTNWATAARVIQDAVDAATAGEEIVVTNGVYATGGRSVGTNLTINRWLVDKPLALRSVNGPQVTIIEGYQVLATTNGDSAIRCVCLQADGASLSGFTLTKGATRTNGSFSLDRSGGGLCCARTNEDSFFFGTGAIALCSNCVLSGNSAFANGGGAAWGTLTNCTITGNSATGAGGGASSASLNDCTVVSNSAAGYGGGGAFHGVLSHCTLSGNSAPNGGGGGASGDSNFFDVSLTNCTLTGNSARFGGGVAYATLANCSLVGNLVSGYGGGGAASSTLNNCLLSQNVQISYGGDDGGGGAKLCTLNNCTLTGNSAWLGGGAAYSVLNNSIVYFNTATDGTSNYDYECTLNYCCTTPQRGDFNGGGNVTNSPMFGDLAGGDLRLQSKSPCINAGNNAYALVGPDLDGNPRIVGGTVDIGAYEFQTPASVISYDWLEHYGLPTDGSADYADPDHDGMTNWQEWIAGTDPTNPASVLRMLAPGGVTKAPGIIVTWESVGGKTYSLERSTNLGNQPAFSLLQSNIVGQWGTTTYTDTNAVGPGPFFYRVGVRN
jgi:parallel beta-helix repeat protein